MEFLDVLVTRRSTRNFSEKSVPDEDIDRIVRAGCMAPVGHAGFNRLRIVVIKNAGFLERINKPIKITETYTEKSPLHGAGTLVVVASSEEPGGPDTKQADSAAIIENMLLAATDLGIQSVFMYSVLFKFLQEPELLAELGLPEGYTPVAAAAFGYSKTGIPEPRPLELRIETRWIK